MPMDSGHRGARVDQNQIFGGNLNNKMFLLVFYRIIKAANITLAGYIFFSAKMAYVFVCN
jgi:hypothetical protein